jgi:hypothetical protein
LAWHASVSDRPELRDQEGDRFQFMQRSGTRAIREDDGGGVTRDQPVSPGQRRLVQNVAFPTGVADGLVETGGDSHDGFALPSRADLKTERHPARPDIDNACVA